MLRNKSSHPNVVEFRFCLSLPLAIDISRLSYWRMVSFSCQSEICCCSRPPPLPSPPHPPYLCYFLRSLLSALYHLSPSIPGKLRLINPHDPHYKDEIKHSENLIFSAIFRETNVKSVFLKTVFPTIIKVRRSNRPRASHVPTTRLLRISQPVQDLLI